MCVMSCYVRRDGHDRAGGEAACDFEVADARAHTPAAESGDVKTGNDSDSDVPSVMHHEVNGHSLMKHAGRWRCTVCHRARKDKSSFRCADMACPGMDAVVAAVHVSHKLYRFANDGMQVVFCPWCVGWAGSLHFARLRRPCMLSTHGRARVLDLLWSARHPVSGDRGLGRPLPIV